jgi:hypothetical protein
VNERKRLTDILRTNDPSSLAKAWESTRAAAERGPLPAGEYVCCLAGGELFNSRTGTPGYKLKLEVLEGEHAGRCLWHDIWLTAAALSMAKRDLGKLGVTQVEQLDRPLPEGIVVRVKVALRTEDSGTRHNRVVRFEVVGIDPPKPDPFAPTPPPGETNGAPPSCPEAAAKKPRRARTRKEARERAPKCGTASAS